jgi:hypothetical protein
VGDRGDHQGSFQNGPACTGLRRNQRGRRSRAWSVPPDIHIRTTSSQWCGIDGTRGRETHWLPSQPLAHVHHTIWIHNSCLDRWALAVDQSSPLRHHSPESITAAWGVGCVGDSSTGSKPLLLARVGWSSSRAEKVSGLLVPVHWTVNIPLSKDTGRCSLALLLLREWQPESGSTIMPTTCTLGHILHSYGVGERNNHINLCSLCSHRKDPLGVAARSLLGGEYSSSADGRAAKGHR